MRADPGIVTVALVGHHAIRAVVKTHALLKAVGALAGKVANVTGPPGRTLAESTGVDRAQ